MMMMMMMMMMMAVINSVVTLYMEYVWLQQIWMVGVREW